MTTVRRMIPRSWRNSKHWGISSNIVAKARLNGINVHYQARGSGADLVLIHGLTSCLAQFGITLSGFMEIDKNQDVTDIIKRSLSIPVQSGFRKGQTALTPRLQKLLDETSMGSEFRDVAGLTEENLAKIVTPVLAIYGATSPYERMAEHLSRVLPNCRYELLAEAGHFYAVEEPALVLERLSPFL